MKKFVLIAVLAAGALVNAQTPAITVTLLGTGVPLLNAPGYAKSGRVTSGTLVQAGKEKMLFDVGSGIVNRLYQSSTDPNDSTGNLAVDKVFLTHLHSDHMADLPNLYIIGWLYRYQTVPPFAAFPLRVWGPGPGPLQPVATQSIGQLLKLVFATDILQRGTPFPGFESVTFDTAAVDTINFVELWEDIVYSNNGVTVRAFRVNHDPVSPSYGFRIDYLGKSVMITGDTTYTDNLVKWGKGADVIVSEAWGWANTPEDSTGLYSYHCPPESCLSKMFIGAAPKLAVLSHISGPPTAQPSIPEDIIARTKKSGYTGPIVAGLDLMTITINTTGDPVVKSDNAIPAVQVDSIPAEMRSNRFPSGAVNQ